MVANRVRAGDRGLVGVMFDIGPTPYGTRQGLDRASNVDLPNGIWTSVSTQQQCHDSVISDTSADDGTINGYDWETTLAILEELAGAVRARRKECEACGREGEQDLTMIDEKDL